MGLGGKRQLIKNETTIRNKLNIFMKQNVTTHLFLVSMKMIFNIFSQTLIFTFKKTQIFPTCTLFLPWSVGKGGRENGEKVHLLLSRDYNFKFQLK